MEDVDRDADNILHWVIGMTPDGDLQAVCGLQFRPAPYECGQWPTCDDCMRHTSEQVSQLAVGDVRL